MTNRHEAERLRSLGLNVLPVMDGTKLPTVPWRTFKTTRVADELFDEWSFGEGCGLGVVTGECSQGLAVLDFDDAEAYGRWATARPTLATTLPTATTGRGFHVFVRLRSGHPYGKLALEGESVPFGELLTDGHLCVLPPTKHPSGAVRAWVVRLDGLPPVLGLDALGVALHRPEPRPMASPMLRSTGTSPGQLVPEGQRHDHLTRMAGRLRNLGMGRDALAGSLLALNRESCSPPLPDREVEGIADWASGLDVHSPKWGGNEEAEWAGVVAPPMSNSKGDDREPDGAEGLFLPLRAYLEDSAATRVEWVVEDLLPVGYLLVVGGTSKAGKSCLLTALALAVAEGRPFLGQTTNRAPVLWCSLEESPTERRIALEAHDGDGEGLWLSHHPFRLDSEQSVSLLRHWVRKTGARLVVVDPLHAAHGQQSLTDGAAARRVLQPLKRLCAEEGVAAVLVHHLTKSNALGMARERLADSGQILAACSGDVLLESEDGPNGSRELTLRCRGRGEFANQVWKVRSPQLGEYVLVSKGRTGSVGASEQVLATLADLGETTAEAVAEGAGLSLGTVRNKMTELVRSGRVRVVGHSGKAKLYQAA